MREAASRCCALLVCLLASLHGAGQEREDQNPGTPHLTGTNETQSIVREGIAVDCIIEPAGGDGSAPRPLAEGDDLTVRFEIRDTATGAPLTGLHPAAWLDPRETEEPSPADVCQQKVQAFISGSLGARSELDLNIYYVLTMNEDNTLSVVDPLFGFGDSKLLALVLLNGRGEDWVLSRDQNRLFVSIPAASEVAVVDTTTWKVVADIEVGENPTRLALQNDEKYLWVGCDGSDDARAGGVSVVDLDRLEVAARIPTGRGHHEIAVSPDDRYALVTNKRDDTLSVIDVHELRKIKDVGTGKLPASLAYSRVSQAAYVANEGDGTITVVDGETHEIVARMEAQPGLGAVRFAPGDRLGFVVNSRENVVEIFDAATNRIVQTGDVRPEPDQLAFTDNVAYIRSRGSEIILMIPLDTAGKPGPVHVVDFTGGEASPNQAPRLAHADAIVPVPEGNAVLVANPVDKRIYYYKEGMAAPMGGFENYGRQPRAPLVVDRSLREISAGRYATHVRPRRSGKYDVAFFLDSPRMIHCFSASIAPSLATRETESGKASIRIDLQTTKRTLRVGERLELRFELIDSKSGAPVAEPKEVGVLSFRAPGFSRTYQRARWIEKGVYSTTFLPLEPGVYYVFFEVPSYGVGYRELPHSVLEVKSE